ncbi:MAG: pirin-like C-terminal cupin domain-containing protein [Bacteroidota bacterium]
MLKSIRKIITAEKRLLGSVETDQVLPTEVIGAVDPFLLLHHIKVRVPANTDEKSNGIGPHPHRGFSAVTFIYRGSIHHRDSLGNSSLVSDGGTQWIHTGEGVIHSERPGREFAKLGGIQEIIQFWVNSPAKFKKDKPYYFPLSEILTPRIEHNQISISVVAGEYMKVSGPIKTLTPQTILRITILKGATFPLQIPSNYNCLIYLLDGDLKVNNQKVLPKQMVVFERNGVITNVVAVKSTRFIVLSGIPINEPIVSYGPYVMNSEDEIERAISDYRRGKMGSLDETF